MTLVISHRTNMGTMPENTLTGIDAARRDGVDGVEIDVRATRDGHVVLLHDASLRRTTGDPRAVADVTLDELRAVRVQPIHDHPTPEPVPTLPEVLAHIAGRCLLAIEVKASDIEDAVARAVRDAGAESWCWIWAFDPAVAVAHRRALPTVPVALNSGPGSAEQHGYASAVEFAESEGLAAVSLHHSLIEPALVEGAHARALRVFSWTVDEPDDIGRVIAAGVDGICGNFPPRIHEALSAQTK